MNTTTTDHAAFTSFLSEETIFFSGPEPLRGKDKVAAWWKRFYEGKEAPFSWRPEVVEVTMLEELGAWRADSIPRGARPEPSARSGAWRRRALGGSSSTRAARTAPRLRPSPEALQTSEDRSGLQPLETTGRIGT